MPNSMSTTELALRIKSIGTAAEKAQRKAVDRAALHVKRTIERETSIATKGSMGYSNMMSVSTRSGRMKKIPKGNAKLRVGYDIVGERRPTALLVARGPWGLVEYGSKEHVITPKLGAIERKGVSRAAYRRAVTQRRLDVAYNAVGVFSGVPPLPAAAGGGKPVYRVNHRGQRGKQPFKRGLEKSRAEAGRLARGVVSNAVIDTVRAGRQTFTYIRGEVGAQKVTSI